MTVQARALNTAAVDRALARVPDRVRDEVREEMRGLRGLGVDYKKKAAKTFEGTQPGSSTRRGEKWLYSSRQKQKKQQLRHYIRGETLDDLTLGITATPKAELHKTGGDITPTDAEKLVVPISGAISKSGKVKTIRFRETGARARLSIGDLANPEFIPLPNGNVLVTQARGGDREDRELFFMLVDKIEISGGRFRFEEIVPSMEPLTIKRFDRAIDRAAKDFNRGRR